MRTSKKGKLMAYVMLLNNRNALLLNLHFSFLGGVRIKKLLEDRSIEAKIMVQYQPRLWLRYVDHAFVIVNRNDLEHFHTIINSSNTHEIFKRRRTKQPIAFLSCLSTET